jgi:hypothetical protein
MATIQKLSYTAKEIDEKLGMVDSLVKTVNGVSPDENGDVAIGGDGFTSTEKSLMMDLLKNTAYTSDMSATISRLEKLWSGSGDVPVEPDEPDEPETITYTVTNNLTGVTNSNSATTVNKGENYSATLTIIEGYTWESVVITMGGVDITNTAYGDGYITIYDVTGDIVVTAVGILPAPVYELAEALVCDGTQEAVDTGIVLMDDKNKEFTVMVDYELNPDIGSGGYIFHNQDGADAWGTKSFFLTAHEYMGKPEHTLYFCGGRQYLQEPVAAANKVKVVITHSKGVLNANGSYVIDDTRTNFAGIGDAYDWFHHGTNGPLFIAYDGFKGTIKQFKVYDRVVIDDEITEFLGVE